MAKVGIMDDCSLFRGALSALLDKSGEHEVCWKTGDPTQALQMMTRRTVRTLIFDPYFRGNGGGLCFVENIHRRFPKVGLLVCTSCLVDDLWLSVMQSGANGFIFKSSPDKEFIHALRKIGAGECYFMDDVKERILKMFMTNQTLVNGNTFLSLRKRQVIERLLEGEREKEIAAHLGVSVSSVATYLARALQTLGLKNKVQLIRFADAHPDLLGHSKLLPARPRSRKNPSANFYRSARHTRRAGT